MRRRPLGALLVPLAVAIVGGAVAAQVLAPATGTPTSAALTHIHDVAIDPRRGAILLATHSGLRRLIDGRSRSMLEVHDVKAVSVVGADNYVVGGHRGDGRADALGAVESGDGGGTWTSITSGRSADLHAIAGNGSTIVGAEAGGGVLTSSAAEQAWNEVAVLRLVALASTDKGFLGVDRDGHLLESADGETWRSIPSAPPAVDVSWSDSLGAVVVTESGDIAALTGGRAKWRVIQAPVAASFVAAADDRLAVVSADGRVLQRKGDGEWRTASAG